MPSVLRTVELVIIELALAVVVRVDVNRAIATDIPVNVTRLQEYARYVVTCMSAYLGLFIARYPINTAGLPIITCFP